MYISNEKVAGHNKKHQIRFTVERCEVCAVLTASRKNAQCGHLSEVWFEISVIFASTDLHPMAETVKKRMRHFSDVVSYDKGEAAAVCLPSQQWDTGLLIQKYG